MAPATKRRKLSHRESDSDASSTSFASFGSDQPRNGDRVGGRPEEGSENEDNDTDVSSEEPRATGQTVRQTEADGKPAAAAPLAANHSGKPRRQSTAMSTALNSAGGDTKATMLNLQIEELLSQMRPKKGTRVSQAAEAGLHELKAAIDALSSKPPVLLVEAERELVKKSRVATPFPDPRPAHDAQYKLEFKAPTAINVVGSYAAGTALRSDKCLTIDMIVQMPDSLFQEKDYSDYRYFYRRAYYIACIAAGLRSSLKDKHHYKFENLHGNPLSPILVVLPADTTHANKWQIHILPIISRKVFTDERLLPSKILIRGPETLPTAFYNSTLQADRQTILYLKLLHSVAASCDDFKDACMLFRIWLGQRGFSGDLSNGGFGGFEAAALMAMLLGTGSLSPRYNKFQLFKATLQYLVTKDCSRLPVIVGETDIKVPVIQSTPILFDAQRSHNLLFKMTPWSYKALRQQARITLSMLSDPFSDSFESTFIIREDTLNLKYDMCLALPAQLLAGTDAHDHNVLAEHDTLYSILIRALGDRITHLDLRTDPHPSWELGSARPSQRTRGEVVIAARLNPVNAGRTVDHGPSAEDKAAAADFRKFWGDRAELRRFKDGSILESLVWSSKGGTQSLLLEVITHVIDRHFGTAAASALRVLGGDLTRLIAYPEGSVAFQPVLEAFKSLESDMRSLSELPLTIRQISPANSQTSSTSLEVSSAVSAPVDVVVQFESSARWPDDIHAVQHTKAAFLLRISALFKESNADSVSRVGLENTAQPALNQAFLDVTYSACTFRLRIHHERETALIQRLLKDNNAVQADKDVAAAALAQYKRNFQATPSHTSSLAKLSTRFPVLSPTTRLLKKWFAAHHLMPHFPEPIIEQIAAQSFLHPAPYSAPGSAKAGFLRILAWIGRWDWSTEPLVLLDPVAEKADNEGLQKTARTRYDAWRRLDPGLNRVALFVASAADPSGTAWTDIAAGGPTRVVAGRMTQLAQASSELIRDSTWQTQLDALFTSSLDDYDFLLHLSADGPKAKRSAAGFKNLILAAEAQADSSFDSASMFVEELRAIYGTSVMLFYGGRSTGVIAGLWNPITAKRAWKVGLGYSTVPMDSDGEPDAVINKQGVLAEFARLGGDLISKIEAK